jgi:hypothetical protein
MKFSLLFETTHVNKYVMMRIGILLALLTICTSTRAQDFNMRRQNTVGNWRANVQNNGTLLNASDTANTVPGGVWLNPSGTYDTLVFGGGLWVGGQRKVGDHLEPRVAFSYEPNHGASRCRPGSAIYDTRFGDTAQAARDKYRVYRSTDGVAPAWPVRETSSGPRYIDDVSARVAAGPPSVLGDQDMFIVYKDTDPLLWDSGGAPLGIEIRTQLSFWKGGIGQNVIVVRNSIINTQSDTIFSPTVSLALDGDVNNPHDDRLKGVQNEGVRGAVFFTELSTTDPFLGVVLLAGQHNSHRPDVGLTSLHYWTISEDPKDNAARLAFMTTHYMDTGTSVVGDARMLMSSASDEALAPGDTLNFDYAFFAVPASGRVALDPKDSARVLGTALQISSYYNQGALRGLSVGPNRQPASRTGVYPNPARETAYIALPNDRSSHEIRLYDALGRAVLTKSLELGAKNAVLDLTNLPAGVYQITIDGQRNSEALVRVR